METTLFILGIVALLVFIGMMGYLISFIQRTTLLINDTRDLLSQQSKQLGETLEKVDGLLIEINTFVKQASGSLEKINEMSEQITEVVKKVDSKANNLMVVVDDLGGFVKNAIEILEKPTRSIAHIVSNFGDYFTKIKSFFPFKSKK